jgi:hypothetical protein
MMTCNLVKGFICAYLPWCLRHFSDGGHSSLGGDQIGCIEGDNTSSLGNGCHFLKQALETEVQIIGNGRLHLRD